jgi:hypothetical protein
MKKANLLKTMTMGFGFALMALPGFSQTVSKLKLSEGAQAKIQKMMMQAGMTMQQNMVTQNAGPTMQLKGIVEPFNGDSYLMMPEKDKHIVFYEDVNQPHMNICFAFVGKGKDGFMDEDDLTGIYVDVKNPSDGTEIQAEIATKFDQNHHLLDDAGYCGEWLNFMSNGKDIPYNHTIAQANNSPKVENHLSVKTLSDFMNMARNFSNHFGDEANKLKKIGGVTYDIIKKN